MLIAYKVLYASSHEKLEDVTAGFVSRASSWGLTVSVLKTKEMASEVYECIADADPLQKQSS